MAYSLKTVAEAGMPIGSIVAYYGTNPPSGWLICDGRSCSGTPLATLTGKTTVPDLRGRFIRMIGGNAAEMAVAQGDAIRNITGKLTGNPGMMGLSGTGAFAVTSGNANHSGVNWDNTATTRMPNFDASRVVPTAAENRPINMAFNYIIKANYSLRIVSMFKEVA